MATAKQTRDKRGSLWLKILLAIAVIAGGIVWFYGTAIAGYSRSGTGYAAKYTCSCRHIGGHDMAQCRDDLLSGMGLIWISEDTEEQSVTATVPLVDSTTATHRDGYGCVLEPWDD